MFGNYDETNLWLLHFDNDADGGNGDGGDAGDGGDGGDGDKGGAGGKGGDKKAGRFMTQEQIDQIVLKKTEKDRRAKKELLAQMESLQETVRMSDEQKAQFEEQIDSLRKQTMTAAEIEKREAKKAKEAYEGKLTKAEQAAKEWETRFQTLKIETDIKGAAISSGVLPSVVPMLISHLRPSIKLTDVKNEAGAVIDSQIIINFPDKGADGNPIETQLSVQDTLKRMKELPEEYGHLFSAPGGGTGTNSGKPGAKGNGGFHQGMSMAEFLKRRKENPTALYGEG
jgi:hypothetical protein